VGIVHDEVVGEKVVVAVDLEVVCLTEADRPHRRDPVPVERAPAPGQRAGRGDMIASPERRQRPPPIPREQWMLGGGDELAPEGRTKSTDHSTAARRGLEHTPRAERK